MCTGGDMYGPYEYEYIRNNNIKNKNIQNKNIQNKNIDNSHIDHMDWLYGL